MVLQDIYDKYAAEDGRFECKARLDRENTISWLKTIDGFANSRGGSFFIGVEDKSNKLLGFESEEIDKEKLYFYHTVQEHFPVMPDMQTALIPYKVREKTLYVLKVDIFEAKEKPLILMFKGMPSVYKRRDGYTSAATAEELISMSIESGGARYDTAKTDIKFSLSDFTKLSAFHKEKVGGELTEKLLSSVGFFDNDGYLRKGASLFMDNYTGDDTSVVCSLYEGKSRGDTKILASNTFKGNLIDALQYMWDFVILHMNKGFIKKDTYRLDIDAFPRRSVFEALVNALAHRDYLLKGADIAVDIFVNRLRITSPGSIFKSDEPRLTYKLDQLILNRRNELISDVFVLCGVMEKKGTGFEKIVDDYKEADALHKPFISSKYNQFSITLPDLTFADGVSLEEDAISISGIIENEGKYDMRILSFCYGKKRDAKDIASFLGISNSSYLRKSVLDNLVKQHYLLVEEKAKAKLYSSNLDKVRCI